MPPLPPRPSSYTPSANDTLILNTLKHLVDLSAAGHESLELDTLSRRSHEYLHNLTKPNLVQVPQGQQPPPPGSITAANADSVMDLKNNKPWDHHNNLNEQYFTPIKGKIITRKSFQHFYSLYLRCV